MKIVRAFIRGVTVHSTDVTALAERPSTQELPTDIRLDGVGFLEDDTRVDLRIRPTCDEKARLLSLFDEIADRIKAED